MKAKREFLRGLTENFLDRDLKIKKEKFLHRKKTKRTERFTGTGILQEFKR